MRLLPLVALLALAACERNDAAPPPGPPPSRLASAPPPTSLPPTAQTTAQAPPPASAPAPAPAAGVRSSSPSRVETRTFSSRSLGVDKRYVVYFPVGYDGSTARFPVLYLLHGLGGNETNWTQVGKMAEAADRLKLDAIVVMPDGDDGFYINGHLRQPYDACLKEKPPFDRSEPPASYCVKNAAYDTYITQDLIENVDTSLRTLPGRSTRAIAGLSMGGFGALSLALRHQDLFGAAASHSGMASLLYDGPHPYAPGKAVQASNLDTWGKAYTEPFRRHVRAVFGDDLAAWKAHDPASLVASLAPGSLAVYLDCGDHDDFKFHDHARHLHDLLAARGVDHQFEIVPGVHRFDLWKERLPHSLQFVGAYFARSVKR